MSQFTLFALWSHFSNLFENCSFTSSAKRQEESRKKLEDQKTFLAFGVKQLEQQIDEHERRKQALLSQRRVKEAKEVVRAKFSLLKKYEKTRELFTFTDTLLEQINNTAVLRDTVATINEAQRVYMGVDHAKIYGRYAKLSAAFSEVQDRVAETQGLMSERMTDAVAQDDSELLAELESCDAPMPHAPAGAGAGAAGDLSFMPNAAGDAGVASSSITTAYARAGLRA